MTRIIVRFHDDTPDRELNGVRIIEFTKHKKVKVVHVDPAGNGLTSRTWKIEQISYIEVGNG